MFTWGKITVKCPVKDLKRYTNLMNVLNIKYKITFLITLILINFFKNITNNILKHHTVSVTAHTM